MCDTMIFQERKITNCEEAEKELRNIIFAQGLEVEKNCKTSRGFGEVKDKKNSFEDLMQHCLAASTPIRLDKKTDLPKCKDYCYLLKLLAEISTLKLHTRIKDELLVQHLEIIKVLTTKLFILENSIRNMGKTPEEIDIIFSTPSFTTQDDDKSNLPLCPVKKGRPCSSATCRRAPVSSEQEDSSSAHTEQETSTPRLCPVKKDRPCSVETCKQNSQKSSEPTPGVKTNSMVVSVTSVGRSCNSSAGKQDANLEKKSVHLLIENNKENMIVEPEKDHDQSSLDIFKPRLESVPVIGVQDSLEILKGTVKTQNSERSLLNEETQNSDCVCETKEEIRRLKNELDEKMRRILELNEENRTLNDMVNALKSNQVDYVRTVDELSDSEPTSSEFEYCRSISPRREDFCTENCFTEHTKSQGTSQSRKNCSLRKDKDVGMNANQSKDEDRFTSDSTSTICKEEICPFADVKYASIGGSFRARGGNDTIMQTPNESFPAYNYTELMDECTDYTCPNKDMTTDTSERDAEAPVCPEKKVSKCSNIECQTECNEIIDKAESTKKKSTDTLLDVNAENSICYDPTCTERSDTPKSPVLECTVEEATEVCVDQTSQTPEAIAITEVVDEASITEAPPVPKKCNIKTCEVTNCLERRVVKISHVQEKTEQVPSEKDKTTLGSPKVITDNRDASPFPRKCNIKTCLVIDCLEKRAVNISSRPEKIDISNKQDKTTDVSVIEAELPTSVKELPAEVVPTDDTSIKEQSSTSRAVQISEKDDECDRNICKTCPSEGDIPADGGTQLAAATQSQEVDSGALAVDQVSSTLKEETCDAGVDVKPPVTDATTSAQVIPPSSEPESVKQRVSTTSSAYGSDLPTEEEMKTEPLTGEAKDTLEEIPTESMKSTDKETPVSENVSVGAAAPIETQGDFDQKIRQDSATLTEGQEEKEQKLPTDAVAPIEGQEQAEGKIPADAVPPSGQSEEKKPGTADKSCQEPCICLPDKVLTADSGIDDSKPQQPTPVSEYADVEAGKKSLPVPDSVVERTETSEKPSVVMGEEPSPVAKEEVSTIVDKKPSAEEREESQQKAGDTEEPSIVIGDKSPAPENEIPQTKSSEKTPTMGEDITPTISKDDDKAASVDEKAPVSDKEPSIIESEKIPTISKDGDMPTSVDEKPPIEASKEPSTIASEKPSVTIKEVEPSPIASEKPSVTIKEVEPSPIASEKPSVTMKEVEPSPITSEKPSVTVTDVEPTPITSEKPSVTIKDEPTAPDVMDIPSKDISEKPSNIPSEKDYDNKTSDPKTPEKDSVPKSEPFDQPDKVIIRCICKSKYCKIVPDPNNPNQKLCVDVSETLLEGGDDDNCVCAPSCPRKDAYSQYGKPDEPKEEKEKSSGTDSNIPVDETRQVSITPKEALVYTTKLRQEFGQRYSSYRSFHSDSGQSFNSLKKLSKEQEYAGLSRKETESWKKTMHIPPRKSSSAYGLHEYATDTSDLKDVDETKNADLKIVIADLKNKLLDAEDKIEELKNIKNFGNKDNNMALIMRYSEEIDHLKKSLKWTSKEKEEYEFLKQKVKLLEQGKGDTDNITSNLQTAVDLHVDTIQLLENSEQKLKSEVEQYRLKNDVMGDSLVYMGQEMEDLNQKFHEDLEEQIWLNFLLHIESTDIQHANAIREQQVADAQKLQLQLMDLNYDLEMEHVNTLQDMSMLEALLYKYQSFLKHQQEDKSVMKVQLKKLSKKNKCYEEIVQFFKEEMSVMSDELLTLQEVLNVTNVSSQEENTRLINAILQLRRINDRLVSHLCEIEKQVVLENQLNQINEARINELQNIIGSKNNDLNQHDQTIQEMRKKLCNATKQNADLKKTIKNLTDAVVEIQEGIKSVERDHNRNKNDVSMVESNVCLASGNLKDIKTCIENKNDKIMELENKLKSQEVSIILATKELDVLKEKKADYKKIVVSLKEQLAAYDKKNEEVMGDFQLVSNQLQDYVNLDHMKNYELSHYKSLVEEMKMSLMQLNQGLEQFEASNIHFYEDMSNAEISFDKKGTKSLVFSDLKKSMADMKRRLSDAEFKGGLIEEEMLKVKESHMTQIQEEVTESQKELETRILASIEEQANLNMLVEQQKEEIEQLKKELQREKLESSNYKQSMCKLQNEKMTSNAQMEILHLKCELNKSIQRQRVLSEENDKIHSKMISLRKKMSTVEQAYEVMKQENEENKMQLKKTLREKEYIAHKNQELTKNIEDMRSSHDQLERQCRYNSDCMQNLQLELSETQNEKDNISSEAQNLAEVVKMWLKEQNVVNGKIRGKFQNYSDIICSLRESMMKRMSQEKSWVKKPMQQPFSPRRYTPSPQSGRRSSSPSRNRGQEKNTCDVRYRSTSPWRNFDGYNPIDLIDEDAVSRKSHQMRNVSYDSNPSAFSSRSPSPRSDYLQEIEVNNMNLNDWFSPNFKETDTDADEGDDEMFINKLQVLTAQVQEANKRWQQKMNTNSLPTSRAKHSN